MNLNPKNAFGELLLDLIEAQYEGSIDNGIIALMQTTGLTEQEVVAVINGDVIVEEEALLSNMLQAFPHADAEDVQLILDVAIGVDESDRADLNAAMEETQQYDNSQYTEEGYGNPAGAGGYSGGGEGSEGGFARNNMNAQFSQLANTVVQQQQQLNNLTVGISNFQLNAQLEERLRNINHAAEQYVSQGMLPPSYKSMLVGTFTNDRQRVAQFSAIAQKNGVDLGTMLFATEYALGMLAEASQFVEFSDYSLTEEDVQLANFSASLDAIVAQDVEAIFNA